MGTTCFKSKRKQVNEPLPHQSQNPFSLDEGQVHKEEEPVIAYQPRWITNPDPDALPESFPNPDLEESPLDLEEVLLTSKKESEVQDEGSEREEVVDLQSKESESKSERLSIRSRRSSLKPQKRSKWNLFQKDENLRRAVKAATRPSKLPNFEEYNKPPGKDDKDFPVKDLERISVLRRDRLPLDILTRKTKILNQLKTQIGMLEDLQLIDCKLDTFPPQFKSRVIRRLDFSNNLIATIPESIEKLKTLEDLNLSQNKLTFIPPNFGSCVSLTSLKLNRNLLTDLTSTLLSSFPKLTHLALNHNRFKSLSFTLSDIPQVKELDLSMNELTAVGDDFFSDETCELVILKLSLNPLKTIGTRASQLFHLERMDLRQTHIGAEDLIMTAIKERNEDRPDEEPLVCLINQLVSYRTEVVVSMSQTLKTPPVANPNESVPADIAAPQSEDRVDSNLEIECAPDGSVKSLGGVPSLLENEEEEEEVYEQADVHIQEIPYQMPPTTSLLYAPLKDMTNQISDSGSIILTIATIEKIVKKGMDLTKRRSVIADVPLTSQYFVERIAKHPSALNILSVFKYQVKDDVRRGLVLRANPGLQPQRKPSKEPTGNPSLVPVTNQPGSSSSIEVPEMQTHRSKGQNEETADEMLNHLLLYKKSVIDEAEKQMNTPDFKAYIR